MQHVRRAILFHTRGCGKLQTFADISHLPPSARPTESDIVSQGEVQAQIPDERSSSSNCTAGYRPVKAAAESLFGCCEGGQTSLRATPDDGPAWSPNSRLEKFRELL